MMAGVQTEHWEYEVSIMQTLLNSSQYTPSKHPTQAAGTFGARQRMHHMCHKQI